MNSIQQKQDLCEQHGSFTSYSAAGRPFTGCPACAEREQEMARQQALSNAREQARRERISATLKDAIPRRYVDATLSDVTDKRIAHWAEACAAGESSGPLVLTGPVGTGKTHTAIAALRHIVERRASSAHYLVATEFTRRMRATWSRDARNSESHVLDEFSNGVLVLDDLGAGPVTPELQDLIAERYARDLMVATIICTNIAAAAFDETFGHRISDRIRDGATLIVVGGRSRRRPADNANAART